MAQIYSCPNKIAHTILKLANSMPTLNALQKSFTSYTGLRCDRGQNLMLHVPQRYLSQTVAPIAKKRPESVKLAKLRQKLAKNETKKGQKVNKKTTKNAKICGTQRQKEVATVVHTSAVPESEIWQ